MATLSSCSLHNLKPQCALAVGRMCPLMATNACWAPCYSCSDTPSMCLPTAFSPFRSPEGHRTGEGFTGGRTYCVPAPERTYSLSICGSLLSRLCRTWGTCLPHPLRRLPRTLAWRRLFRQQTLPAPLHCRPRPSPFRLPQTQSLSSSMPSQPSRRSASS